MSPQHFALYSLLSGLQLRCLTRLHLNIEIRALRTKGWFKGDGGNNFIVGGPRPPIWYGNVTAGEQLCFDDEA